MDTQVYVPPAKQTAGEYLLDWLEKHETNLRPKTRTSYHLIITKHLIPELGRIRLDKLTPLHLRDYYDKMLKAGRLGRDGRPAGEPLSARTVQHHHRVIREALQHAVKRQLIVPNPADAVEAPKPARAKLNVLSRSRPRVCSMLLGKTAYTHCTSVR